MKKEVLSTAIAIAIPFVVAAQVGEIQVGVKTRRPLSEAADLLEAKYGWIVTYEDMPVVGKDVQDITALSRPLTPNAPYRTLIPLGIPFAFSLDESKAAEGEVGAPAVIATIVDAYNHSGNPGQFHAIAARVPGGPMVFHLVPSEGRDAQGRPTPYTPLLDTRISLPAGKRSLDKILREIGQQLKLVTGVQADAGSYASNYLQQTEVEGGATNEVLRDLLRRLLVQNPGGRPLSWWLFCDPHGDLCPRNVHFVGKIHAY